MQPARSLQSLQSLRSLRSLALRAGTQQRGLTTIEVKKDVASGIMTIAFNRPERMNAWNHTTTKEYLEAFADANRDDRVRCTVLTGNGKAFCSGADISEGFGAAGRKSSSEAVPRDAAGVAVMAVLGSLKPAIAAVNGAAVGVGASCLLSHDFIFASESAKLGFVFTQRGVSAEGLSSLLLPKFVGPRVALDWLLTGRIVPATEARDRGFVNQVVPDAQLLDKAYEFADRLIKTTSPLSVAMNRSLVWRALAHPANADIMHMHTLESNVLVHMIESTHAAEGVASFFERRAPKFDTNVSQTLPSFFPWWKEERFGSILEKTGKDQ